MWRSAGGCHAPTPDPARGVQWGRTGPGDSWSHVYQSPGLTGRGGVFSDLGPFLSILGLQGSDADGRVPVSLSSWELQLQVGFQAALSSGPESQDTSACLLRRVDSHKIHDNGNDVDHAASL